jgi:hypothetical protein
MRRARWLPALLLIGLLNWACESKLSLEGRYAGQPGQGPAGEVTLVLQSGGKGQWTTDQETTSLRWEERSGALWLHLKTGGVMVARPVNGQQALALDLPGAGSLTLRKATH